MLYKERCCSMKIDNKVKKVIKKTPINNKIKHYDSIYNATKEMKKENNLPNLENRHKSEDFKNLKYSNSTM